ncbi:MAG TPA: alpha/beta hydrolase [Gaiellaceae bacterium]|nr:alpha/beta hydrolase [Gaiellaceae bacterium]
MTTVIVQHGTPSSGKLHPWWVEDAKRRGIELVGHERAGYGDTPRAEGRDIAWVAQDIARFADERGIEEFATWGISGGGPHALACAALLPDRVVAAAAIGSPAPYDAEGLDWFAGYGEGNVVEFETALQGEEPLRALLEREAAAMLGGGESALDTLLSPPDLAILPQLQEFLGQTFAAALGNGVDGWVDDDLAFVGPWGFDLAGIRVPVLLVHGVQDVFVPVEHARWLAAHIPGVDVRLLDDEGHLSLYARIPEVHDWLLPA